MLPTIGPLPCGRGPFIKHHSSFINGLVLLHNASSVCAEGGEQGGEDGDHNLTDALQGVLRGVFHWTHPQPLPKQGGECLLRGI